MQQGSLSFFFYLGAQRKTCLPNNTSKNGAPAGLVFARVQHPAIPTAGAGPLHVARACAEAPCNLALRASQLFLYRGLTGRVRVLISALNTLLRAGVLCSPVFSVRPAESMFECSSRVVTGDNSDENVAQGGEANVCSAFISQWAMWVSTCEKTHCSDPMKNERCHTTHDM